NLGPFRYTKAMYCARSRAQSLSMRAPRSLTQTLRIRPPRRRITKLPLRQNLDHHPMSRRSLVGLRLPITHTALSRRFPDLAKPPQPRILKIQPSQRLLQLIHNLNPNLRYLGD